MCHIFSCFGWTLDVIQRIVSCLLASLMCMVICLGSMIVIGAGIAYGYNVSLAEYLDLKKSDITVYVRRGQFGGKPEFGGQSNSGAGVERRSNDIINDYGKLEDVDRSLSDAWNKAQETRNYADKLTKYSKMKSSSKDEEVLFDEMTSEESSSPDYEKPVEFQSERPTIATKPQNYNRDPPALYPNLEDDLSEQEAASLRPIIPIRTPKRKKPDIVGDVGHEAINLNLNASKYLYNQEDFDDDDEEEKDFIQKPL